MLWLFSDQVQLLKKLHPNKGEHGVSDLWFKKYIADFFKLRISNV
jgi:hypothetical protein